MSQRAMGICPECGRHIRGKVTHGPSAMQQNYESKPEMAGSHPAMETFGVERQNFKVLIAEASRQLMIEKIQEKLAQKFGVKIDDLAQEMVDFISQEKKMKRDFWKQKISMEDEVYQAFSDLFAA